MSSKALCALAIVTLCLGCDEKKAPAVKPAPTPTAKSTGVSVAPLLAPPKPVEVPSEAAVWRVGEEKLAVGSAAIRRVDERTVLLRVATDELGCEAFEGKEPSETASFITFELGIDPRSTAKQRAWRASWVKGQLVAGGVTRSFELGNFGFGGANLASSATVAGTEIDLGLDAKIDRYDMTLKGELKTKGCGEEKAGGNEGALMRFANQRYRLRGGVAYTLDGSDGVTLVLSTRPPTCESMFPKADLAVTLSVSEGAKKVTYIDLTGSAVSRDLVEESAEGALSEVTFDGSLAGSKGSVTVKLPGIRGKAGELPFLIDGEVEVLRCGQRG